MPNKRLAQMFGMCKLPAMDIAALRKEMGLTQGPFAALIGLKSKGHLSELENRNETPSVRVALEIERLSGGRISAASLNPDVALVRCAPPIQAQPAEDAPTEAAA